MAIPAGTLIGFILARCKWPFRPVIQSVWLASIFLPLPIVASAWLGAFGNAGRSQAFGLSDLPLISGWSAAAMIHALAAVPVVVWVMSGVMLQVDDFIENMARIEFSMPMAIYRSTIRKCIPAAVAASLAVLIMTAGDMTVTDLVQERTFAEEAYLQAQMGDGLAAAARTSMAPVILITILILIWAKSNTIWYERFHGGSQIRISGKKWLVGWPGFYSGIIAIFFTIIAWGVPIVALAWRAGRSGGDAIINSKPSWSITALIHNLTNAWPDLAETLPYTLFIASITAIASTLMAWILAEISVNSVPFQWAVLTGAAIGFAVPGPVAGLAVQWLWMPWEAIYDSWAVIIAAQVFRLMPIAVLLTWPSVQFKYKPMNDLARLDGLSVQKRFWRVQWPTTGPVALASTGVVFALSIGELPATNMVTPPGVEMLSVRIWGLMHTGVESHLSSVVLACMIAFTIMMVLFTIIRSISKKPLNRITTL
jgi:iron(III) transport system permease protein